MVLSVEPRSVLRAYVFFVATLLFGLPIFMSYYVVSGGAGFAWVGVLGYVVVSLSVGVFLLVRRKAPSDSSKLPILVPQQGEGAGTGDLAFLALAFGTVAVASYGAMKYFIHSSFPYPSHAADLAGGVYLLALALAAAIGIPYVVVRAFPAFRDALEDPRLRWASILVGVGYFITYEILVNEILISGYNTSPGNFVQSPTGNYPWAYIFTSGPAPGNLLETALYVPYALIQLIPPVNLIFQPFEVVFAIAISTLVSATVAVAYHTIRQSERMGGACSVGATLSGVGAFVGYTATCPSCLAPTLISVVFGGLASAQGFYSNLTGVVIPPLVSIVALLASLLLLQRGYARRAPPRVPEPGTGNPSGPIPTGSGQ